MSFSSCSDLYMSLSMRCMHCFATSLFVSRNSPMGVRHLIGPYLAREGFKGIHRLIGVLATGLVRNPFHTSEHALAQPVSHVASMDGSIAELMQLLEDACRQARTYNE